MDEFENVKKIIEEIFLGLDIKYSMDGNFIFNITSHMTVASMTNKQAEVVIAWRKSYEKA